MEQVFLNLYVNAWQAMPGGGNIYLETKNEYLNDEETFPYAVKPGKYVKITITDTGTGMDEKTKEKIFEPFFTTKEGGIGVGMAITKKILSEHDGKINITDFSILMYFWNKKNPANVCADINSDGRVDLKDFSVMLYWWTGK